MVNSAIIIPQYRQSHPLSSLSILIYHFFDLPADSVTNLFAFRRARMRPLNSSTGLSAAKGRIRVLGESSRGGMHRKDHLADLGADLLEG
jgi:hypothetical protein